VDGRFDRDFKDGYDVLIDCVDSFVARREMHYWSLINKKPVISMGTDYNSGNVVSIVPGETSCLDCRRNVIEEADKEEHIDSCIADPDPSVLSSNLVVASLGANEYDFVIGYDALKPINGKLIYNSQVQNIISTTFFDHVCNHYDAVQED